MLCNNGNVLAGLLRSTRRPTCKFDSSPSPAESSPQHNTTRMWHIQSENFIHQQRTTGLLHYFFPRNWEISKCVGSLSVERMHNTYVRSSDIIMCLNAIRDRESGFHSTYPCSLKGSRPSCVLAGTVYMQAILCVCMYVEEFYHLAVVLDGHLSFFPLLWCGCGDDECGGTPLVQPSKQRMHLHMYAVEWEKVLILLNCCRNSKDPIIMGQALSRLPLACSC